VVAVGWAVPGSSTRDYSALQRRLLLHAQACSSQIVKSGTVWCGRAESDNNRDVEEGKERNTVLVAVHFLGNLYAAQGKLSEAEQMYERALRGREDALEPTHTSTLDTVNNLGILYANQGKLDEAEQMYERALRGYEAALGSDLFQQYKPTLNTLENIGDRYAMSKIEIMHTGMGTKNQLPYKGCGCMFWRAMRFCGLAMGEAAPPMFELSAMLRRKALVMSESAGRLRKMGWMMQKQSTRAATLLLYILANMATNMLRSKTVRDFVPALLRTRVDIIFAILYFERAVVVKPARG
jgi:tetratricopeptide (TPR) repeat protein